MLSPSDISFIVNVGNWDCAFPTNPKYFTWHLARLGYKTLGVALQSPLPAGRRLNPAAWTGQQPKSEEDNLWLLFYQWPMLMRTGWGRRMNIRMAKRNFEKVTAALGFPRPTYYLHFTPTYFELALELNDTFPLIYRCIDDFSIAPLYKDDPDYWLAGEQRMFEKAYLNAPLGRKMYDRISAKYANTRLISTGVDVDLFTTPQAEPEDLKGIAHPRIGFCGAIDAYKIDFALAEAVAAMRPDWQFVYVGGIGVQDKTSAASLPKRANLHFLGYKPHPTIPAYVQHFDLAVNPMNINEYTTGINPLKLYENYAVGLPIVSTPLPYVVDEPTVYTASTADEFAALCDKAFEEKPQKSPELVEIARRNSWSRRAEELIEFISDYAGKERSQATNAARPLSKG